MVLNKPSVDLIDVYDTLNASGGDLHSTREDQH